MDKKRILVLNYEFPPLGWGGWVVSYDIAKWLIKLWYEIDVITMWFKDLKEFEQVDWINIYRVKCLRTKKEICHPREQLTYLFIAYKKAKELLWVNKYDICHCHFIIPTWIIALKLKQKFGLEYIITAHGSDVLWYNPRFKMIYPFLSKIWKNILENSKYIISPSNFLKLQIENKYLWNNNKILIIPNWININKYNPWIKKKIILWTWRLIKNKWFHNLAKTFSEIEDTKWYELHICWDWIMMNELKIIQANSKNPIILHWWINNNSQEFKELLESTSIFCLPSKKENASISLLEAMSAGCAIITSNISWCPETLGEEWILINPEDNNVLRQKLELLINNDDLVKQKWILMRTRLEEDFDLDKIILEYNKLLNG